MTTRRETIDAVFARVASEHPDEIALAHGDRVMTYRELERRTGCLARYLVAGGLAREQPIGVLVERSFELAIALLGIVRAGGAFVPLDPTAPPARNQYVLGDCGLKVIVSDRATISRLGDPTGAEVVLVDEKALAIMACADGPLPVTCEPDALAYVLYTSGSTGTPKGVLCLHGSVTVLAQALATIGGFGPGARVVQFSAINFDVSVGEIFGSLLNGATLILARREDLMPGADLASLLERTRATTLLITPSSLALVPVRPFPELHTILVAGESCHPAVVRPWLSGRRVVNAYGPTECTVYATSYEIGAAAGLSVPIGSPLPQTSAYLLDAGLAPVADGTEGELYIGGASVGRGYAGRPAQTAARFLPDPFSDAPGARMYKTGDVCVRENGQLTFLRRDDGQLKVNGIRIEPEEIEAAILATGLVRYAAVGVRKNADGDAELVAAVLRPLESAPPIGPLRDALAQRLPPAMVPSRFAAIEAFPRTPSGKIDRRALFDVLAAGDAKSAPNRDTGPGEILGEVLAAFRRRLDADAGCDYDTDFFAAGGTSLAAARLLSELGGQFGAELRYRAFFAEPTARAVARTIGVSLREGTAAPAPPREPSFTRNQQRLFLLERIWPGTPVHNVPVPFELHGPLDVECLRAAFGVALSRHEELRRSFALTDGVAARPLRFVTPDVRVVDAPGAEPQALMARFAQVPMSLECDAPVRLVVAQIQTERFAVMLLAHHIVFDARSREIFLDHLSRAYRGESLAPALSRSSGEERVPARGYWREYLRGLPAEQVRLGTLDSRAAPWSARCVVRVVRPEAAAEAEAAFQRRGLLPTTGYAAFVAAALRDVMGAGDLIIGIPVEPRASREAHEIGFHSAFVPLRFQTLERGPFDPAVLEAANDALLEGIDTPPDFEDVLQLVPRGGRGVSSFCDVVLVGGERPPRLELGPRISVVPFEVWTSTARFPLLFSLERDALGVVRVLRLEYQTARCSDAEAALIADGAVTALERYLMENRAASDDPAEAVRDAVRETWRDLTGADLQAGVNFFDAGANSLTLLQLHARLQLQFPALDILDLFVNVTLDELVAHLVAVERTSSTAAVPAHGGSGTIE
jgi:amino acid adenylation domain-containing protein